MKYYLVVYTDGTIGIYNSPIGKAPAPESQEDGAKIYEVSGELDVADISEISGRNGWDQGIFPVRLEKKITRLYA